MIKNLLCALHIVGYSFHLIVDMAVEELILDCIHLVTVFVRDHEDEFVQMVTKKTRTDFDRNMSYSKLELEQ